MAFKFLKNDINKISKTLGVKPLEKDSQVQFVLEDKENKRRLSLEIFSQIPIGESTGNLISVYTANTHLQLHYCQGYVLSDTLGEVTFISENNHRLCGLTIEKQAACSFYANVEKKILASDFVKLEPEVMIAAIAMSLTEHKL